MSWVIDQHELHITIGSSPQTDNGEGKQNIDLHNDLSMVKAALLYGDKARLCSPVSSLLFDLVTLTNPPKDERLELLKKFESWGLVDDEDRQKLAKILYLYERAKSRRYSKKGRLALKEIDGALDEVWQTTVIPEVKRKMSEIGVDGISRAVQSGLLEIYDFDSSIEQLLTSDDYHDFAWEYVNAVASAVSDSTTYPLFDEDTGNIISAGILTGKFPVSEAGISRGKEVGLAANLFNKLPLFPDATVQEVLDIRRELEKPLTRFRSSVIAFSDNIKNAAWDRDFSSDAEQVFARDVAPAVLNLEAEVKSNSFISNLAHEFSQRSMQVGGVVTGSIALSGLALRMSNLPLWNVAALAIGPILAAGGIAISSFQKWKSEIDRAEQNNLFFYYRAGRLLEEGKYEYVSDGS